MMNVKLGAVGVFLMGMGLIGSACVGQTESSSEPEPVGEAQQASQTCSSDCSGVTNGIPFSETCATSCTANTVSITCDGTYYPCPACAANYGQSCGTPLHCSCHYTIPKHYNCDGVCVPDESCSCCGNFIC